MTEKHIVELVLAEIRHIKENLPNGDVQSLQDDINELREDIRELKKTLLNPTDGVIVNTNKNTEFRRKLQSEEKEFLSRNMNIEELMRWKSNVNKALWLIFSTMAAFAVHIFYTSSQ